MSEKQEKVSVETLLERLNEITVRMETEKLPLSEMMQLFKEGKALEKQAKELLDLSEKEIQVLSAEESPEKSRE